MANKAYLEITNACNLRCSFCAGTKRQIKYMNIEEFTHCAAQLRPFADYLYFHLMGEPLLHPHLTDFFEIAHTLGFRVIITTNGTLLPEKAEILHNAKSLHKVSISIHSYEANKIAKSLSNYLLPCLTFCRDNARGGKISVLRLWNEGGEDKLNKEILEIIHSFFDNGKTKEWECAYNGYKISDNIYLEYGDRFDWPTLESKICDTRHSCYGLRDQIGVLSDGTVVPCCLDAEGVINLGNLFTTPLTQILEGEKAKSLRDSFRNRKITEELCVKCPYAHKKFN